MNVMRPMSGPGIIWRQIVENLTITGDKMKSKKIAVLTGDTIMSHLLTMQEMKSQTFKHFQYDSPLWKAIRDHVHNERENPAFFDIPPEHSIAVYRGTGVSIVFKSATVYQEYPPNAPVFLSPNFLIDYNVTFISQGWEREIIRSYSQKCPVKLELNFSKAKFATWLEQVRAEKDAVNAEKELSLLAKMVKKYPKEVKRLLKSS